MTLAGLVLAAGAGTRLGVPKALVRMDGELLVERAVRLLTEGGAAPVIVVLGAAVDEVRAQARLPRAVHNPDWAEGIGSSLRVGLAALDRSAAAVVVALADQPLISPEAVRRLAAAWRAGATAAVATYAGAQRNPVLLDRTVWTEVAAEAAGDRGARDWLRGHPELVTVVGCDDAGSPYDIDTPADLAGLAAEAGAVGSVGPPAAGSPGRAEE